jgi:hypothetical protein
MLLGLELKYVQPTIKGALDVVCYARDYQDARTVALAQHPNAQIISVTAVFN